MTAPSRIISLLKSKYPAEALQLLPDDSTLSRGIRKIRQPDGSNKPKSRPDIMLTEDQKTTFGNEI
jgi:hypothetical protein